MILLKSRTFAVDYSTEYIEHMNKFISYCLVILDLLCCTRAYAQELSTAEQQELWNQPDFVRASLLVVDPGEAVYSIFGHACFRLECDYYDLDYCYTYEAVMVPNKIFRYLTGQLKMGMMAIPTAEFLKQYASSSRGVKEYPLQLPMDAKRYLWQVLDEKVLQGCHMPYDYIKRGCASSCIPIIERVLGKDSISYPCPLEKEPTRRETLDAFARDAYPWQMFFVHMVTGTEIDRKLSGKENIILPIQLAAFWQQTTYKGQPLLSSQPHELLPSAPGTGRKFFTPLMVAILLLLISLLSWKLTMPWWPYVMLGLITIISPLPCTEWNWLIVPFNILPAVFWHWRRYWAVPYAAIIVLWTITMAMIPHRMTDPACLILALAWAVVLLHFYKPFKFLSLCSNQNFFL